MSVSIVIPNWNGLELLTSFFPSVIAAAEQYRARSRAEIEVIVVDDASTDDGLEWLREHCGHLEFVTVLSNDTNLGFLRTVNKGFSAAKGDVVFLLNSDVAVEDSCIGPLVRHFDDPNVFAVCCRAGRINSGRLDGGGKIGRFERGFWRVFLNYEAIPEDETGQLASFFGSGGYTAYDRKKWTRLRGFQDCLTPNYWEDVEICYRAWKRGWKVLYEPDSHVRHLGSATMRKKPMHAEMAVVTERNRLLMTWINLHDRKMFAYHLVWLTVKLLGSAVSLKWNYLRSFSTAFGKLAEVRAQGRTENKEAMITDTQLVQKFAELVKRPGIYVVATEAEEHAFKELRDLRAVEHTSEQ